MKMSTITNATKLMTTDDDPFKEDSSSSTAASEDVSGINYYTIYRITLYLTSSLALILIIYSINRFKFLRNWENKLILHWAVASLTFYVVHSFLQISVKFYTFLICLLVHFSTTCIIATLIFAFGINFYYVLSNYRYTLPYGINRNYFKACLYLSVLLEMLLEILSCHFEGMKIFMISFQIIICSNVILNLMNWKYAIPSGEATKTRYVLQVGNAVIFSWLPLLVYHHLFFDTENFIGVFVFYTLFIPEGLAYGNPILVAYLLNKSNKDFNKAFKMVVKAVFCQGRDQVNWNELADDHAESTTTIV